MTKLSTPPLNFFQTLKQTYYYTYLLLTALSSNSSINHEFTTLRNC